MRMAKPTRMRKMPTGNLDLVRDRVQLEQRSKRRPVELAREFSLCKNSMSCAEFVNVMVPNVLPKLLQLTPEIFLGFLFVESSAPAARNSVPR